MVPVEHMTLKGTSSGSSHRQTPSEDVSLDEKVAFLSQPEAYREPTARVERVQTHMAWVFLTDQHAWKLKKPVRYDFLDFSTVQARHADGQREVELNRRLAPDVYLGVVPLQAGADRQLSLGEESSAGADAQTAPPSDAAGPPSDAGGDLGVVDWLVQMRRLPADAALDQRIKAGTLSEAPIRQLAELLTEFYQRVHVAEMSDREYRHRFQDDIRADREALLEARFEMPAHAIERTSDWLLRMLRDQPRLFDQRIRQGKIVEAHGDLRPQHIYTVEPTPVIIDCLEFNADFRILDPLDELSFFALECERLGAGWVGQRVRGLYQDAAGDHPPAQLLEFYTRRRAILRAKLAVWHTADDTVDHHERWKRRAEWYLHRADPVTADD